MAMIIRDTFNFVERMILRPIFVPFVRWWVEKKSGIMERLSAFPGTAAGQRPTYNYVGKKVEMVLRKVKMAVENKSRRKG